jgi:uncharacterized membrane protein
MKGQLDHVLATPGRALAAGAAITLAIMVLWIALAGVDRIGFLAFVLRSLHVVGAIVWIGMVWFVNFVQLVALAEVDDAGRGMILKSIAPRVAAAFRNSSHLVLATGLAMLVTSGYLLDIRMFGTNVYIPPLRNLLLWGGTLGGLMMWAFVHFRIWPSLQVVLGERPGDADAKAAARATIRTYARLNLVLALPVTFVMVAAAHLY